MPIRFYDRHKIAVRITVGMLMLLGIWKLSVETLHIDVTQNDVYLQDLPGELDGIRIVQLSDMHLGPFVPESLIERAVETANKCNADYAVVTGDFVSQSSDYADKCMEILTKLTPRRGIYMVAGNHDYSRGITVIREAATRYGLNLMTNSSEELMPGLYIAGIDDESKGNVDIAGTFKDIPKDSATVVITHEPQTARLVQDRDVLVLTGHTHGGQIGIPFITRKFMDKYFAFRSGWYQQGKAKLYVNRGIGFNGIIPMRFRCNPEVSVFILHPAKH